jgi:hypothetical protein
MLLLILWSCSLVKLKNQLSPLILVLDSRCRIRLDNLELKRNFKDSSFFFRIPTIFLWAQNILQGKLKGSFFCLCFGYDYNVFFAFWNSSNEVSFVFAQIFALQCALKVSFLLIVLTTNFGDATKLFIII